MHKVSFLITKIYHNLTYKMLIKMSKDDKSWSNLCKYKVSHLVVPWDCPAQQFQVHLQTEVAALMTMPDWEL